MKPHRIAVIPGDGIGPEVTEAVVRIFKAAGATAPALEKAIGELRGGREAAVGGPLAAGEEARRVQLHRGGQLHDAAEQQPHGKRAITAWWRGTGAGRGVHRVEHARGTAGEA